MASPSVRIAAIVLVTFFALTSAADPDPLQDFCVADNGNEMFINGVPCINPAQANAQHFKTSALAAPGNTNNRLYSSVTAINTTNLAGVNTQGLIMARSDFAKGGVVPPHNHPRASELLFVMYGTLNVGFVDTNNTLFAETLNAGDVFVFPRGLVHFLQNVGNTPASTLSALNSQNPGASLLSSVLFTSNPPIPDMVLEKAFNIDGDLVQEIRKNLGA